MMSDEVEQTICLLNDKVTGWCAACTDKAWGIAWAAQQAWIEKHLLEN